MFEKLKTNSNIKKLVLSFDLKSYASEINKNSQQKCNKIYFTDNK